MARIKRGIISRKRHNKIRKAVKGYIHTRRASIRKAKEAILKAGQHAYIDRKKKKRNARRLWILKVNAGLRNNGTTYSKFIKLMADKKIKVNRKILAELAEHDPEVFTRFVKEVTK